MDELHKYIINLMQDQFGVSKEVHAVLVQVTNLIDRTTLCNMFLNMASSMIERW